MKKNLKQIKQKNKTTLVKKQLTNEIYKSVWRRCCYEFHIFGKKLVNVTFKIFVAVIYAFTFKLSLIFYYYFKMFNIVKRIFEII